MRTPPSVSRFGSGNSPLVNPAQHADNYGTGHGNHTDDGPAGVPRIDLAQDHVAGQAECPEHEPCQGGQSQVMGCFK